MSDIRSFLAKSASEKEQPDDKQPDETQTEKSRGIREFAKDKDCDQYKNEDGTFKDGFQGAVKYFECQGHDHESATKIAGKIAAEKGEAGGAKKSKGPF